MRTLIRDVSVFDGEQTVEHTDVLIDGDTIAEPDGSPVDAELDGRGQTLLPGLIDAHTHVFDGSLAQALEYGVTTELDMFARPPNLRRQRRLAAERDDVADLRSAGMLATAPGGHPTQLFEMLDAAVLGDAAGPIDTVPGPGQAEEFVQARLAEGIDYLKIVLDDGSASGMDLPALGPDTVAALIEAGHAAGLRTVAHAVTVRDALVAVDAGVDVLAHVYTDVGPDDPAGERYAERIAEAGVFVVSTLSYFEALVSDSGPGAIPVDPNGLANAIHATGLLRRAGVPLLAGTDSTFDHGRLMHRELEFLVSAGFTPAETLAAATSLPARCFGLTDRGRIAPGMRADLLLVEGDPTDDITATGRICAVFRRGSRTAA